MPLQHKSQAHRARCGQSPPRLNNPALAVNRGNNAAENTLYSGTIGAVIEAALQAVPAIALSQFFGPANKDLDDPFEAALHHGAATVRALLDQGIWTTDAYPVFYNVNFPPVAAADVKQNSKVYWGERLC